MRPVRFLLAPLLLTTPLVAGCGRDAPSVPPSAIAVVGQRTISRGQLDALMDQARESYVASKRSFPAAGTAAYDHLKQLAVSLLVEQAELGQEAPKLGVRIEGAQVEARLKELKEQSFGGSEKRYRARLRAAGMTDGQVRWAIRSQLTSAAVRQAVTAEIKVGAQAVEEYYESHLSAYSTPPTRIVRHILVRSKVAAERVYARARAGERFAELARRFSRDSRTRERGGALTLVEGRTAAQLDQVAFSLPTRAVSRPFRTSLGWELVEATAPVRPRRVTPLATVRDAIRRRLIAQRRAEVFRKWLARVHDEYARKTSYAKGYGPRGEK
jgi:parvulin-like peptidyl-prolyl isomerase